MRRILFLVKNYIGFGHIRRCLLVADEISSLAPDCEIIFISQAKSLRLFRESRYQVINFPFLHRLPTNSLAATYESLLNKIVAELRPNIVVEDTYPDEWYLSIPALENTPRVLLLRRLEPVAFEHFRRSGLFDKYDRVLMVGDEIDFFSNQQAPESDLLIRLSRKFKFIGPIFKIANREEMNAVELKYRLSDQPLIVVNAGAGGDQSNDAYAEHLFFSMTAVAERFLAAGIKGRFLFVIGPYYAGSRLKQLQNVVVVDFEPQLADLLSVADVLVIRPGFNVTMEALNGNAQIVIVPGLSYMEGQYTYAQKLSEKYGVALGILDDPDLLFSLVTKQITEQRQETPERQRPLPQQRKAAETIIEDLEYYSDKDAMINKCYAGRIFLTLSGVRPKFASKARRLIKVETPEIVTIASASTNYQGDIPNLDCIRFREIDNKEGGPSFRAAAAFLEADGAKALTPQYLLAHNIRVIMYTERSSFGVRAEDWCRNYSVRKTGLLEIKLSSFSISRDWERQLVYRIKKHSQLGGLIGLRVDATALQNLDDLQTFLAGLKEIIQRARYKLVDFDVAISELSHISLAVNYEA